MDQLKRVLTGREDSEVSGICEQVSEPALWYHYAQSPYLVHCLIRKKIDQFFFGQMNQATSLSWSNRIMGFGVCLALGFACIIIGFFLLLMPGGLGRFVGLYTLGNILSIGSTLFLMGPWKQMQRMFNNERWVATLIYFVFLGLTIFAVHQKKTFAAIICCVFQFLAMLWYSASYIPFAQKAIKNTFSSCVWSEYFDLDQSTLHKHLKVLILLIFVYAIVATNLNCGR